MGKIKRMWYVAYTTDANDSPDPVYQCSNDKTFDYVDLEITFELDELDKVEWFASKEEAEKWAAEKEAAWDMDSGEYLIPVPIDIELEDEDE